ncbi:response regulator [Hufsiella ginkgonis]|uniref:Response regulator n=1 Tax=Hufsiella ginkgonis TaxID=2695274 RepID=A0A7K1XUL2_9SPHI|nr:response regulator [Hufsiella ginkgonis]MXV14459.1 response regulator [Hufsiella ginkgonis]
MGKKVFIADDDPAIVDVVTIILEDAGYEVSSTVHGEDLMVLNHASLPDLFLLDIWMYGKDGRDICSHLKNNERTKHIPVIIVSAVRDVDRIAREYHADGFLAKPFEMDELLALIRHHLPD